MPSRGSRWQLWLKCSVGKKWLYALGLRNRWGYLVTMYSLGVCVSLPMWHVFRYRRGSLVGNTKHHTQSAFNVFRERLSMMFHSSVKMSLVQHYALTHLKHSDESQRKPW